MASLVHHQAAAPMPMPAAAADDEAFMPQSFGCFGRSLSRASSGRRLEYRALAGESEEMRSRQERSARAKLRWKAVAQEIIMASRRAGGSGGGSGGHGARRRKAALPAFSYDSRSYALNFDQGDADE
ncbi:uncharacterized protein LOC100824885 [Brachypodium distachyon]|uniref:Uncharacterized protein n=1 Tax=Brachypodium distachyon TaxID=15368 RepID=I1GT68_BRADI|nr:uncharacterized protein LOC100824885 [Brachypodium distachyon]KQK15613.1 hypothetical protein BRADI_1g23950v3 [Brachypodium distachyon]|eukprot:XP_014752045.1 uncharacterized protein LOC100824885 [Brachypodium distachyon]